MRVNSFHSPDGRESLFYPTQGIHESYNHFLGRVSGFQANIREPDQLVRKMIAKPAKIRPGSFTKRLGSVSAVRENKAPPGGGAISREHYFFHMRENIPKKAGLQGKKPVSAAATEPSETLRCDREVPIKPKKNIFQRMFTFFTRCFCPASTQ